MFVAASPIVPLLAFIENLAEIRIDAFKLTDCVVRPYPQDAQDIGTWEHFMLVMAFLSILSNTGLMVFTAQDFEGWDVYQKLVLWLGICCSLCAAAALAWHAVPDEPLAVTTHRARAAHFAQRHKLGRKSGGSGRGSGGGGGGVEAGDSHGTHREVLDPNDAIERATALEESHAAAHRAAQAHREDAEQTAARLAAAQRQHEQTTAMQQEAHTDALAAQASEHGRALAALQQQLIELQTAERQQLAHEAADLNGLDKTEPS